MTHKVIVLLFILVIIDQRAVAQGTEKYENKTKSVQYIYQSTINRGDELCMHMEKVFNISFGKLWDRDVLLTNDDSHYSANGRYAFPKFPGVEHDNRITAEMSYSKFPSSSEFEAVEWKETRVINGAPVGIRISGSDRPFSALVAYFDFDNDGQKDTVMKYGFTGGYNVIRYGGSEESVTVWRAEVKSITVNSSLWKLQSDVPDSQKPIAIGGQYVRPFIYKGHAHVAQYEMEFADFESGKIGPYKVSGETMSVFDYRYDRARNNLTQAPAWTSTLHCRYQMKQVN
jgi:hypothetical protein